jgi:hypothetical protein
MQWNDLDYEVQRKVYDRLEKTLLEEPDEEMQNAIVAAIEELEHWDNSPCPVQIEENVIVEFPTFIEAQDTYICCSCIIPWFCRCYCHKGES